MSETKKDNGFTRWSKKHAELWKFIKYSIVLTIMEIGRAHV